MTLPFLERKVAFAHRTRKPMLAIEEDLPIPKCWGYARVSDPKQQGNTSTETQPEQIKKEFARNWEKTHDFAEVVADVDSGWKFAFKDRPGGKKLLRELKPGDCLIVSKVDRFSRSMVDGLTELKRLWEKGIKVVLLDCGGSHVTFDGGVGEIYLTLMLWVAQQESKRKSERATEAYNERVRTGKTRKGKAWKRKMLYGTTVNETGRRVAAPEHREFVRKLMALYLYAMETFHFTKCDRRHQRLAQQYGLTWWENYARKGREGVKAAVPAVRYLSWFKREMAVQAEDAAAGKPPPLPVDQPWKRDYEAGTLIPEPPPIIPHWLTPINRRMT